MFFVLFVFGSCRSELTGLNEDTTISEWVPSGGQQSDVDGAALEAKGNATLTLYRCTFSSMGTAGTSAGKGGAVFLGGLAFICNSCWFNRCNSLTSGGAIYGENLQNFTLTNGTEIAECYAKDQGNAFVAKFDSKGSGAITLKSCNIVRCFADSDQNQLNREQGGLLYFEYVHQAVMRQCKIDATGWKYREMACCKLRDGSEPLEIDGCTFRLQKFTLYGGFLTVQASEVTYTNTAFEIEHKTNSEMKPCIFASQSQVVTITACKFTVLSMEGDGAAIDTQSMTSCTITGCTFTGCSSTSTGRGGVVVVRTTTTCKIDGCTFSKNSAGGEALALRLISNGNKITVNNCKFREHTGSIPVLTFSEPVQSARLLEGESLTITNCEFTGNPMDGQGTLIKFSKPTRVEDCIFQNNGATVIKGSGGRSTFENCYFALYVNKERSNPPMILDDESVSGTTFAFNNCSFVHYACPLWDNNGIYVTLKNAENKLEVGEDCCFDEPQDISIACAGGCALPEAVFENCQPWSEAPSVEIQCPTQVPSPIEPSESETEVVPIQSSEEQPSEGPHESGDAPENKGGDPNTAGIVVGVIIAILVIVAVVLILLWLFVWKRRHEKSSRASDEQELSEETTTTQSIESTENFDTSAINPLFGTEKLRIETFAANFEEMID